MRLERHAEPKRGSWIMNLSLCRTPIPTLSLRSCAPPPPGPSCTCHLAEPPTQQAHRTMAFALAVPSAWVLSVSQNRLASQVPAPIPPHAVASLTTGLLPPAQQALLLCGKRSMQLMCTCGLPGHPPRGERPSLPLPAGCAGRGRCQSRG